MAIARFKSFDRVRELLEEVGVNLGAIDPDGCIQHAIGVLSGEQEPLVRRDPAESIGQTEPALSVMSPDPESTEVAKAEVPASPNTGVVIDGEEDEGADDDTLTPEEQRQGALVGRVEARVAGMLRKVPRKLMLSPNGSGQYLLAQRHSETGALDPALLRGSPRAANFDIDGVWRET